MRDSFNRPRLVLWSNRDGIGAFPDEGQGRFGSSFPVSINSKENCILDHLLGLFKRGFYPLAFQKIETADAGQKAIIFSLNFERTIDQSILSHFFHNLSPDLGFPLIFGKFPSGSSQQIEISVRSL